MQRFDNLIAGIKTPPASGQWIPSLDPYRNENWCEIPDSNGADVDAAVAAARSAFTGPAWRGLSATARAPCCGAWAVLWRTTRSGWPRSKCVTTASS